MQDYQKYTDYIESHLKETKRSAAKVMLDIEHSDLRYQIPNSDPPVTLMTRTLHIPKIFDQKDLKVFKDCADKCTSIFNRVIEAYKKDPKVRRVFGFTPALNAMVLMDPHTAVPVPMLRVDIFYNEETGDYQFCEFNTDGTSAMFENQTMNEFLKDNNAFMHFNDDVEYMELIDSWIDALLENYEQWEGKDEKPSIVITDYLEKSYYPELKAFEKAMKKRGLDAEVVDMRELDYNGQNLINVNTGKVYDLVYRRTVTKDVLDHFEDSLPLILAARDGSALIVGGFQTQIIHSKMINEALLHPDVQAWLNNEQIAFIHKHLPETFTLTSKTAPRVLEERTQWILKPKDGYAAKGVWAGVDVPEKLWKKLVHDFADTGYIAQRYITHFHTPNIDPLTEDQCKPYANMTGLYVYNGKFAGVYSRLSDAGIISTQYNEKMIPTLFKKKN